MNHGLGSPTFDSGGLSFRLLPLSLPRRELILFVIIALVGVALHQNPLGVGMAMAMLPVASWLWGEPFPLTATLVGMVALMIMKRLASNPGTGIPSLDRREVLLNRLLFDRDIRERELWIRRTPEDRS